MTTKQIGTSITYSFGLFIIFLITSMTLIPESIGGERVYLGNIVCANSKSSPQCKNDEVSNLYFGNPCIMTLAECKLNNDSNLKDDKWTQVEINGPDWTSQSRLREALLSKLTRSSLQQSILLYSIATSATLALFVGLYVWAARSRSKNFVIFIVVISGIPHLWTFLGSIYPAINSALLLAISLASTALLQSHEKKSINELCIIICVSLGAFYLASGSRFDLYLASAGLLSISTFSVYFGKHEFNKRNWFTAIAIQTVCWFIIYINRLRSGSQLSSARKFASNKIQLSEAPEVAANLTIGVVETGSISQRIWYALTAPIYYFLDWIYPFEIRGIVGFATTLLLVGCVLLFLILGVRRGLLESERKLFKRFDNFNLPILITILALPVAPASGHLRLRMIAVLLFPLGLNYLTKRQFQIKFVVSILSFFTVFNLAVLIPKIPEKSNFIAGFGLPMSLVLIAYIFGVFIWFFTTIKLISSE